jgi:hypothetical protein
MWTYTSWGEGGGADGHTNSYPAELLSSISIMAKEINLLLINKQTAPGSKESASEASSNYPTAPQTIPFIHNLTTLHAMVTRNPLIGLLLLIKHIHHFGLCYIMHEIFSFYQRIPKKLK